MQKLSNTFSDKVIETSTSESVETCACRNVMWIFEGVSIKVAWFCHHLSDSQVLSRYGVIGSIWASKRLSLTVM